MNASEELPRVKSPDAATKIQNAVGKRRHPVAGAVACVRCCEAPLL